MHFSLSNRQAKELDRGAELRIAIPEPWYEEEAEVYVRRMLRLPAGAAIISIEEHVITCMAGAPKEGSMFPQIALQGGQQDDDWQQEHGVHALTMEVQVIAVAVRGRRSDGRRYPLQWAKPVNVGKAE